MASNAELYQRLVTRKEQLEDQLDAMPQESWGSALLRRDLQSELAFVREAIAWWNGRRP